MAVQFFNRREINEVNWNKAIDTADNGLVYAYSFYLDALCSNWDALVLNDYEAVMPLPWRKKYGISYIYSPAFTAQLGLFGNNITAALLKDFLKAIPEKFKFWDFPLNHKNLFALEDFPLYQRSNFILDLQKPYSQLYAAYRENIRRNIKKAVNYGCYPVKDIDIKLVVELARQQSEQSNTSEEDLSRFEKLFHFLKAEKMAITYGVCTARNDLIASCAFTFSHHRAYYILVGNHPNGRTLGASHQLIDVFIKDHANQKLLLDFEGSDLRNLAFFYNSFGAVHENYASICLNRLPWWIKWMKKA
jgi:hypothetical protein